MKCSFLTSILDFLVYNLSCSRQAVLEDLMVFSHDIHLDLLCFELGKSDTIIQLEEGTYSLAARLGKQGLDALASCCRQD